jgi:hypothetical protein
MRPRPCRSFVDLASEIFDDAMEDAQRSYILYEQSNIRYSNLLVPVPLRRSCKIILYPLENSYGVGHRNSYIYTKSRRETSAGYALQKPRRTREAETRKQNLVQRSQNLSSYYPTSHQNAEAASARGRRGPPRQAPREAENTAVCTVRHRQYNKFSTVTRQFEAVTPRLQSCAVVFDRV